jgi:hypothetical protein
LFCGEYRQAKQAQTGDEDGNDGEIAYDLRRALVFLIVELKILVEEGIGEWQAGVYFFPYAFHLLDQPVIVVC